MIWIKTYTGRTALIAMCDEDIVGKVLTDKNLTLDLKKHAGFYTGEKVSKQEAKQTVSQSIANINAVGKESVSVLKELGLAKKIVHVENIPHAQVYLL